jgi:hypothetical protein
LLSVLFKFLQAGELDLMSASGDASGVSGFPGFPACMWVFALPFLPPEFFSAVVSLALFLFLFLSSGLPKS